MATQQLAPPNTSGTMSARIIGNWGDPGLSESGMYDFLSRFLIVQLIPSESQRSRLAGEKDYTSLIKIVLRPPSLWIFPGIDKKNRFDYFGSRSETTNAGNAYAVGAAYLTKGIQPITPAYKLGELITVKKMETPLWKNLNSAHLQAKGYTPQHNNPYYSNINFDVFQSYDDRAGANTVSDATATPLVPVGLLSTNYKLDAGILATMTQPKTFCWRLDATTVYMFFEGGLFYITSTARFLNGSDNSTTSSSGPAPSLSAGVSTVSGRYSVAIGTTLATMNANGLMASVGGVFVNKRFNFIEYIDVNSNGRTRPLDSGCIPNVIVSPSTFPSAVKRNLSAILVSLVTTSGSSGAAGVDGSSGSSGTSGVDGVDGVDGSDGSSGTSGTTP